jgi:hypothetical protein
MSREFEISRRELAKSTLTRLKSRCRRLTLSERAECAGGRFEELDAHDRA